MASPKIMAAVLVALSLSSDCVDAAAGASGRAAASPRASPAASYDKMAIYFGDWHVDPHMQQLHGPGWTEWGLVTNARPRYEGHFQPNVPMEAPGFGINASETDPKVMELKLKAAAEHGITTMLFDWCDNWRASGALSPRWCAPSRGTPCSHPTGGPCQVLVCRNRQRGGGGRPFPGWGP